MVVPSEAAGFVNYGYDYSNRMLQASDGSSSTPYQIGYDTAGRANSYTDQLGRNTQVAYDGVGNQTQVVWPAGISGTGSYSVSYQYNAMNRMQYAHEGGTNNLLTQYTWDGRWPSQGGGVRYLSEQELCPVHRVVCDERAECWVLRFSCAHNAQCPMQAAFFCDLFGSG
jgi:YD repeat-containing protein